MAQQKPAGRRASKRPLSPDLVAPPQPLHIFEQQSSPPLKARKCKVVRSIPPISTSNMFEGLAQDVTESCKVCKWEGKRLMTHLDRRPACSSQYDLDALREQTKKRKHSAAKRKSLAKKIECCSNATHVSLAQLTTVPN